MSAYDLDASLSAAFAEYRSIEPDEALVRRTVRVDRRRRHGRLAVVGVAAAALASIAAAPAARTALADGIDWIADAIVGGAGTPASEREGGQLLNHLAAAAEGSSRVLVRDGDLRLVAFRAAADGRLCLSFGAAVNLCGTRGEWTGWLGDGSIASLPRTNTPDGGTALWGLVAPGVSRVRVRLAGGGDVTVAPSDRAFVVRIGVGLTPESVEALDADGAVIDRVPAAGSAG